MERAEDGQARAGGQHTRLGSSRQNHRMRAGTPVTAAADPAADSRRCRRAANWRMLGMLAGTVMIVGAYNVSFSPGTQS